jgi:acyl-CoA synthetase (AMP-forming)/AMP-acid ligase II
MSFNIADLFEHAVDLMPDRTALICADRRLTFAQLDERANRLAHHLLAHGIGEGAHIGYYTRNLVETVETLLAAFKLRAVAINVNYRYVADELRYLFSNADLGAVVYERAYAKAVQEVWPDVPTLRHALVIDDGSDPGIAALGVDYDAALAAASPERDFGPRSSDDLYILYTGGTTGAPKGVMWRHIDVWRTLGGGFDFYTGQPIEDEWQMSRTGAQGDPVVWFTVPPLIHAAAQWPMFQALFAGSAVVLTPQFEPADVWRQVAEHKVNILVITGDAMARPLLDVLPDSSYDRSSLFSIGSGAALFSPAVKRECLRLLPGVIITDSVGASETGFSGISIVDKDKLPDGGPRIARGAETVVLDEDNRQVQPGSGVIGRLARSGHIPLGYYRDPQRSAAMFVEADGVRYAVPGDQATVEADGTIHLLGRGNMCINTGGEKVFPEEVEATLKAYPDVFDALVIAVPDHRYGQRVAAVVQPRAGVELDLAALTEHARAHLAGYKVPRSFWVTERITRLPSGKPDYRWAQQYTQEHPQDTLEHRAGVLLEDR